ncbi:hypothetical protein H310_04986 [Aphanomyces invadans]|uniref:PX domain-containing protein n=1 Tax=Aphanomyces invadans TaxID=157072 RepID=A0A024UD71_9STRA|nr:hypothetical protein H310_04986 [Aphanomyces invadans]ETW03573.1 hypothetical protein H310_04986 [Aphanomyces invadans]|eukprot:XP_008867802.1 hypothetical protein H310_04986 [Aphanomyces invadans]
MEDHLEIHLLANRSTTDESNGKYTNYTIYIKNVSTGQKHSVQRRYSHFYELRNQLLAIVNWGHCPFCTHCCSVIKSYPFPKRTPLSWQLSVVQERIDGLALFLKDILRDLLNGAFRQCHHADTNIRLNVIRSFLEVDEQQLMRRVHKVPPEVKVERFRSFLEPPRVTPEVTPKRKVSADTCPSCLSKWIDCYCNDDEMFSERIREVMSPTV